MAADERGYRVDSRTELYRGLWGYQSPDGKDLVLTSDAQEIASNRSTGARGLRAYVHSGVGASGVRPIYRKGTKLFAEGLDPIAYSWVRPDAEGLRKYLRQISRSPSDQDEPDLGLAYLLPDLAGDIHSQTQTITQGNNTLRLNLAAGGYIESWEIGGAEYIQRGDSWGRGMQQTAEWVDMQRGHLTGHKPSQSASRHNRWPFTQGGIVVSVTESSPAAGGKQVDIVTIPVEFDPDGFYGVPGAPTDHGGSQVDAAMWTGVRCRTTIVLEYGGTTNLHFVSTQWEFPFSVSSGFFDMGLSSALFLDAGFNEVYQYDALTDTATDVSASVDAVDWRRWSVSPSGTFEDEQASPSSASNITSGFGGIIARATPADVAFAVAGRMHPVDAGLSLDLASFPRGTQASYMTNRTGLSAYDGDRAVVLGWDNLLTGRWHSHDSVRTITAGSSPRLDRFYAFGTLAEVRSLIQSIPATY